MTLNHCFVPSSDLTFFLNPECHSLVFVHTVAFQRIKKSVHLNWPVTTLACRIKASCLYLCSSAFVQILFKYTFSACDPVVTVDGGLHGRTRYGFTHVENYCWRKKKKEQMKKQPFMAWLSFLTCKYLVSDIYIDNVHIFKSDISCYWLIIDYIHPRRTRTRYLANGRCLLCPKWVTICSLFFKYSDSQLLSRFPFWKSIF